MGEIRREYVKSSQKEEELACEEHGFLATNAATSEEATDGEEITVSQGEACVTVDCPDDLEDHQRVEAESYAALYALGGYTYNNVVVEAPEEMCNSVSSDKEDSDSDDGFDETDSDKKVDEEELIKKKSKYEQSFI